METQKIVNLLNIPDNEYSKFAAKNGTLLRVNQKTTICMKIQSSLFDYSDAYVLVTENIAVTRTIAAADDYLLKRKQPIAQLQKLHLKIMHHLKTVEQKTKILLLIMQILLILRYLCTI